jgi:hypothetical protein
MAAVLPRLTPLPPSLLDEIASANPDNRFAACVAVSSGVWGHGFLGCRNDVERADWLARLSDYLLMARNAWMSISLTPDEPFSSSRDLSGFPSP